MPNVSTLTKVTYTDNVTVITADNLNDIQDAIIEQQDAISTDGTNITAHKPLILDSSFNFSTQGGIQTASWTASSSTTSLTILTQDLTLTQGVWLILARVPDASATNVYTFRQSGGTTDINQENYFNCESLGMGAIIVTVSSATTNIRLQTGNSTSTTYSNLDRGGLQAIRLR